MQDGFKFNAIVTGYYYIEDERKEVEPQIYLKDVDLHSDGEISVSQDNLEKAIRKQYPDLKNSYIARIMEFFQNSSNHTEPLILTPDKILQCSGLRDKNGKLIYEGDIVKQNQTIYSVNWCEGSFCFLNTNYVNFTVDSVAPERQVIIGNIYENPELLEAK